MPSYTDAPAASRASTAATAGTNVIAAKLPFRAA